MLDQSKTPVWHRLAREMRRDGAPFKIIAAEFGCSIEDAQAITGDIAVKRGAALRWLHADPDFAAKHSERASERMKRLNADPDFAAKHSERMKRLHADPEYRSARGFFSHTGASDSVIRDGYAVKRRVADIAAELGVTRSVVIGRARVLGLQESSRNPSKLRAA